MQALTRLGVVLLCGALAGCAGQVKWTKPGATQADFDADKSFCEYEAIKYGGGHDNSYRSAFGSSLDLALRRKEIAQACMRQKGWVATRSTSHQERGVTVPSEPIPNRQDIPL